MDLLLITSLPPLAALLRTFLLLGKSNGAQVTSALPNLLVLEEEQDAIIWLKVLNMCLIKLGKSSRTSSLLYYLIYVLLNPGQVLLPWNISYTSSLHYHTLNTNGTIYRGTQ